MRALCVLLVLVPVAAGAQTFSIRGFAEGSGVVYPQEAPVDPTRVVVDFVARGELFYKPAPWLQFAGGLDLRANSHEQVEDSWRIDYSDRGVRRPRVSVRRLSATVTRGGFTLDAGKQFVRWGKTDIVTPTDHFAPRDYINVVETDFLAIDAVRVVAQIGDETFDGVWAPSFTPSRIPLLDQRWSGLPPEAAVIPIIDEGSTIPSGSQLGVRWSHTGAIEYAFSYFDGFNHLPAIRTDVARVPRAVLLARLYPPIRAYGADIAAPTPWFTVKGETAYFAAKGAGLDAGDDYILYVVQVERQSGEWMFVGGYAGEVVTESRPSPTFAPDRGLSKAVVARASYTLDPNRSVAFEGAVRQNGEGVYVKGEYSQAHGQHWRTTVAGVAIGGDPEDFLGQYRRNSHVTLVLRYSY